MIITINRMINVFLHANANHKKKVLPFGKRCKNNGNYSRLKASIRNLLAQISGNFFKSIIIIKKSIHMLF